MKLRLPLLVALAFLMSIMAATAVSRAAEPGFRTQVVEATYRIEHPQTKGTAFVIQRPQPGDAKQTQLVLVTAAHAFEKMKGNEASLTLRSKSPEGEWTTTAWTIEIRREDKPLWVRHAELDVAVLLLPQPDKPINFIPLAALATAAEWKSINPEPGAIVRCVGFPHASHFKPDQSGFPLTRLGCIASFPLLPLDKHPNFLVDYNTFEGDSGGPVYLDAEGDRPARIVGLVHAQHFLDERYELVYQQGLIRKRLGLAIVVNSQAILDTIAKLPGN